MASATAHAKGSFSANYGTNNSHLLERRKLNAARRSTPDSEALASSDDEMDQHTQSLSMHSAYNVAPKPVRRSSWLSDVQNTHPRKYSFSGASFSSNNSQPSTPSGDQGAWSAAPAVSRTSTANNFPWSSQIWGSDTRKEPPSRLTEVLQSPTSAMPPRDDGDLEHANRDYRNEPSFPFQIPLEPNRKAYRSQSYSVGQTEADAALSGSGAAAYGRVRGAGLSSVKGRRSRPSMLGEFSIDSAGLGQVREDDDDDESSLGSDQGVALSSSSLRHDMPNDGSSTLLKQATTVNPRVRHNRLVSPAGRSNGSLNNALVPNTPTSDSAIEEVDDLVFEHPGQPGATSPHSLTSAKRAQWQSSLGFGAIGDVPQSRRHSFADVPSRSGFTHPFGEDRADNEGLSVDLGHQPAGPYGDRPNLAVYRAFDDPSRMPLGAASGSPVAHGNYMTNPYATPSVFARPAQQLHIVSFKCARADVYYIPEGTGLEVKAGDMVIVDGDRGMDLGTVTHANVSVPEAKRLKDEAAKKHFEWLMMFSRTAQVTKSTTDGMLAASGASAVGGMRPPSSHQGASLHNENEIRPKMIKRLAQNHEIQMLRDKEGSEAKAKRVCSAKVVEHSLNMEILDAEFQLDWKKLTFFYYAESYINFNDLVQDLFKIYKTRIWMSAINPASFATGSAVPPHVQSGLPQGQPSVNIPTGMPRSGLHMPKGPDQDSPALTPDVLRASPFPTAYGFQPPPAPYGYARPPGQPSPLPQAYPPGNAQSMASNERLPQPYGDAHMMRNAFAGRGYLIQPNPIAHHPQYAPHTDHNDPWHRTRAQLYDGLPREFANLGFS